LTALVYGENLNPGHFIEVLSEGPGILMALLVAGGLVLLIRALLRRSVNPAPGKTAGRPRENDGEASALTRAVLGGEDMNFHIKDALSVRDSVVHANEQARDTVIVVNQRILTLLEAKIGRASLAELLVDGKENSGGKAVFIAPTGDIEARIRTLLASHEGSEHCVVRNGQNIFHAEGESLMFKAKAFFRLLAKNNIEPGDAAFVLPAEMTPQFASARERARYGSRWRELFKTALVLLIEDDYRYLVNFDTGVRTASEARKAA
jgi:hypothetical protein